MKCLVCFLKTTVNCQRKGMWQNVATLLDAGRVEGVPGRVLVVDGPKLLLGSSELLGLPFFFFASCLLLLLPEVVLAPGTEGGGWCGFAWLGLEGEWDSCLLRLRRRGNAGCEEVREGSALLYPVLRLCFW